MRAFVKISSLALLIGAITGHFTTARAASFTIIPTNQTWRYIVPTDNTFCLETGWQDTAYDDSGWAGPSPGGFTGGETTAATVTALAGWLNTTTLPAPTALAGRPYYFRTHFNVADVTGLNLNFTNRVDDQAVWYINGVRVFDDAHPDNPEVCTPGGAGGGEATTNFVFTLTSAQLAGVLVNGDNVLAVSVHQNSATSSDLVFGTTVAGEVSAPASINYGASSLTNRTIVQCVGSTTLSVSAGGSPPPSYQWTHAGTNIPGATGPTFTINNARLDQAGSYNVTVSNAAAVVTSTPDTVVTVTADTTAPTLLFSYVATNLTNIVLIFSESVDTNNPDFFGNQILVDTNTGTQVQLAGQTFVNNTRIDLFVAETDPLNQTHGYAVTLSGVTDTCAANTLSDTQFQIGHLVEHVIPFDSTWKYNINNGDLRGTGWETPGFNDSAWPSGPAGLGHESDNGATNENSIGFPGLNAVPIRTHLNYASNGVVAYFRQHFTLPATSTNRAGLVIHDVVEDGAVYYLNGQEVWRTRVPAGPLTFTTLSGGATEPPAGGALGPISGPFIVPAKGLVAGDNVIAVAVYQSSATSSDLEMAADISLVVAQPSTPTAGPRLTASSSGGFLTINWSGGGTLQRSVNLNSPANWQPITGATSGFKTNVTAASQMFFRVTVP